MYWAHGFFRWRYLLPSDFIFFLYLANLMSEHFQFVDFCFLSLIFTGQSQSRWKIDGVVVFSNAIVSTSNTVDIPYKKSFLNNWDNPCRNNFVMTFTKDITMQNLYHLKTYLSNSIWLLICLGILSSCYSRETWGPDNPHECYGTSFAIISFGLCVRK